MSGCLYRGDSEKSLTEEERPTQNVGYGVLLGGGLGLNKKDKVS